MENGQPADRVVADRIKRDLTAKEIDLITIASQQAQQIVNIENREYDDYYKV